MPKVASSLLLENPKYDPNNLIDTLKSKLNIKRDSTLASLLGIEGTRISKIRLKMIPVGPSVLERMRGLTGITPVDLQQLMLPGRVKPNISIGNRVAKLKINETDRRNRYSSEFKLNAVRLVSDSVACARVAKNLKLPYQTLHNWYVAYRLGTLVKPVGLNTEEMVYLQVMLKKRAKEIGKGIQDSPSKQEKKRITGLQKKLEASDPGISAQLHKRQHAGA